MRHLIAFILALTFACTSTMSVSAQAGETIWLVGNTTAYKTGETVIVTVNAISATPIQGFTFQIRYDPACLDPVNAASPIPSMNGLLLPQTSGLVDASFASTTPQVANGVLAEVRFVTLAGCQTDLVLESAALAIRNESGFAAPVAGVAIGEKNVALNIDKAVAEAQSVQPPIGTPLSLSVEAVTNPNPLNRGIIVLAIILLTAILFGVFKLFQKRSSMA